MAVLYIYVLRLLFSVEARAAAARTPRAWLMRSDGVQLQAGVGDWV